MLCPKFLCLGRCWCLVTHTTKCLPAAQVRDMAWSRKSLVMVEVQPQVLEGLKKKKGMKDLTQVLVIFLINNFLHSHLLSLFNLCCVRRPPSKREELRGSHLDVGLQLYSTAWHPDLSSTSTNAVIMAMAMTTIRMIWVMVIGIRMRDNLQQPIDELRSRPPC